MHHFKENEMNKLQMAHDFAMKLVGNPNTPLKTMESIVDVSWEYADAMQAEADKREVSIEEAMKDHVHDYIYGRVCACGKVKDVEEEWQPDWSQAPEWANWWAADKDLVSFWHEDKPKFDEIEFYQCGMFCDAPSFNYQGNWKESLRERHDTI